MTDAPCSSNEGVLMQDFDLTFFNESYYQFESTIENNNVKKPTTKTTLRPKRQTNTPTTIFEKYFTTTITTPSISTTPLLHGSRHPNDKYRSTTTQTPYFNFTQGADVGSHFSFGLCE